MAGLFGRIKDDTKKTHPGLIPYEELSESEKEKDRELVKLIPALLQDIDIMRPFLFLRTGLKNYHMQ